MHWLVIAGVLFITGTIIIHLGQSYIKCANCKKRNWIPWKLGKPIKENYLADVLDYQEWNYKCPKCHTHMILTWADNGGYKMLPKENNNS